LLAINHAKMGSQGLQSLYQRIGDSNGGHGVGSR
jgi:hypothetical protein